MKYGNRRSIRLKDFDYSQEGFYFVTLVTVNREPILAEILDGDSIYTPIGDIMYKEWFKSAEIRKEIVLYPDEFVIMPNHIHGIVRIENIEPATGHPNVGAQDDKYVRATGRPIVGAHGRDSVRATGRSPQPKGPAPKSLGSFIAGFKSSATKRINQARGTPGKPVWLRNYYEHVIRNEKSLANIRDYIETNPLRWEQDRENPDYQGEDRYHRWPAARF